MSNLKNKIFEHKENNKVIEYLQQESFSKRLEFQFCETDPCENIYSKLKTHPEMIDELWHKHSSEIPIKCQAVLFGRSVLVNPKSGILFAFAEGTYPPVFRVPKDIFNELLKKGGKIQLSNLNGVYADAALLGEDWIYCFTFIEDINSVYHSAFKYSSL